ncbi:serine--tRNA ligase [Flammeovirga yaeyamensis]|uniref:Serine--tRNA ligase n=1 Tax=Flammeovirga yaeyamensis TaxID=367791 RepID=A0AAX1N591_9BACT|nr:serine--tRNA ligase [Flammeovirga yaeyamensis]MBB3698092.1 seryl-tRNA synthetase [Flammeovirga yaeyamensis]NMF34549.1 serine--tRNA ligase [Flammeovirga yaeyamensis]QWG01526.1 serine--tRNA ligase [Flammeovirga yaeyamensis]
MLLVSYISENKLEVIQGLQKRYIENAEEVVEEVLSLDAERRQTQKDRDDALAEANKSAKEIGMLMKNGQKEEAEKAKASASENKQKAKELSTKVSELEESLQNKLYHIPNIPHPSVPLGKSDEENEVMYEKGEKPTLAEGAKPHWDLIEQYDIIDFELGNKVTGAGFPFYKGKGARMQRALISFFLDEAVSAGYLEVQPPIVINEASGYGTGQLPDKEGQMYYMQADNLYMIPTAEVPITNMYRGSLLQENELPKKMAGHTPCFRREAGSWGAHVRGLNRLHQFDKVEIVEIQKPEDSAAAQERMVKHVESLLEKLGLPYRRLLLCSGDLGINANLCFDLEVYSAAQERWLEVSSISNFGNYQANRLKLRYRDNNKKTQLLHTLNGSALALPRVLAAILENNQTEKGILVPEVLQKYTGFDLID